MKNIKYLVPFLIITLLFSCTKSAGTGGRATIKGNIVVDNINILGNIVDSYDAQDQEVYIIYGQQNNTHDDDVNTSYDGTFEFSMFTFTVIGRSGQIHSRIGCNQNEFDLNLNFSKFCNSVFSKTIFAASSGIVALFGFCCSCSADEIS